MKKFIIINGPNLNMLGIREPDVYGRADYDALLKMIAEKAEQMGVAADVFQRNGEGELVDLIQSARGIYDAIIINLAAYTHYSYAIFDAIKAVGVPTFEVHISNIDAREDFRKNSVTAGACAGSIRGMGLFGYLLAMEAADNATN